VRETRIDALLRTVPVAAGDAIFMPGGRVHALDAGCLILEVQQNSNTTYRIYDWGRVGHDGRPRETHLAQALRVIRWQDEGDPKATPAPLPIPSPNHRVELVRCPYFFMERISLRAAWTPERDGTAFEVVFSAHGALRLKWPGGEDRVPAGTSVLLPAALGGVSLEPCEREAVVLRMGP
jgi:mannose-6-phosphate isomerase